MPVQVERAPRSARSLFIANAPVDRHWRNQLVRAIERARPGDLEFLPSLGPESKFVSAIPDQLAGASAAVVLASRAYLKSPNGAAEIGALVERARAGRLRLSWVAIDDVEPAIPDLQTFQVLFDPRRPLATMSSGEREDVLATIAGRAIKLLSPPLPSPEESAQRAPRRRDGALPPDLLDRLSSSSRRALTLANASRLAAGKDRVHIEHLVYGLFQKEGGPLRGQLEAVGIASVETLRKVLQKSDAEMPDPSEVPELGGMPTLSRHAQAALAAALALAEQQRTWLVRGRQLAYGVLSVEDCSVVVALRSAGVENPVPPTQDGDSESGIPGSTPLDPSGSPDQLDHSRLAGFAADTVAGQDRLDVSREALNLAMVVAHKDIQPPISVGLFGDWGSGKSFFMARMRGWIEELARRSKDGQGSFCEHVVQLEFNAWHYMDSNLWASLAREIFEGLANAVADRESKDATARERLRRATQSTRDVITATEAEIREKEIALDATQRRLADVERATPSHLEVGAAALRAALDLPEVKEPLRQAAKELHLDEGARTLEELKGELDELGDLAKTARAVVAALRQRWAGLALGLAGVTALSLLAWWLTRAYGTRIAVAISTATFLVGEALAAVGPIVKTVKGTLGRVQQYQQSVEEQLARGKQAREAEARARVEANARELNELKDRKEQAERRLAELRDVMSSLEKLSETRQLVDFIRQRDASSDYRAQLGTIARASQDFRRLSELMTAARDARSRGNSPPADGLPLPTVDRIVLYIDDLDRCPEDKVVDVLQAVHLLLAYPLFVVVVGVDPRWLLHSLEQHSLAFRADHQQEVVRDPSWRSTALNYLEKIFQIPYTLRPMERAGFQGLIADLAAAQSVTPAIRPPAAAEPQAVPAAPVEAATPAPQAQPQDGSGPPGAGAAPPLPATQVAAAATPSPPPFDPNPRALRLEETERKTMASLFDLIPTPRAAKRFVNVYRLIRASIESDSALRSFVEEREFVSVQLMLAMVTGAPAEAAEILRELLRVPEERAETTDFWKLVDQVMTRHAESVEWKALLDRLQGFRTATGVPRTCEHYRKWADDVARYSFFSGRILLGPEARVPASGSSPARGPKAEGGRRAGRTAAVAGPARQA